MSKPMLIPIHGNMFGAHWERCDALLVTTNAFKRGDGSVVMGKGAALQLANLVPGIDLDFGQQIQHLKPYGLVWTKRHELDIDDWVVPNLGAFQVKRSFKDLADLDLIEMSCVKLVKWCKDNPKLKVRINFPGIGNGGLNESLVTPILEELLPLDQVSVWKFK